MISDGYFSIEFKNLINSMIHPDPERRATLDTILQDPWYLKTDVSTKDEARSLFDSRQLIITQLPAVTVTQTSDIETKDD